MRNKHEGSGIVLKLTRLFVVFLILLLAGCGKQSGSDSDDTTTVTTDTTPAPEVSAIQLTASLSVIGTSSTTNITARLLDDSGQLITDEKTVTFSLDNPTLASIISPATTSTGSTSQTLTSGNTEGTVVVTASVDNATADVTIQISDQASADTINVSANPGTITVNGTSVVSATVLDSNGLPLPDGTTVNFSVNNTSLGTIVASAATAGGAGVAQATFSAGATQAGTATITATSGSASGNTTLDVIGATAGSIEFDSATPQIVVIQGAGGQETSEVKFLIKDSSGNPIATSETVRMVLSGPNGGEYLGDTPGTTTLDVGTVAGFASAVLHSGTIPGTATINASILGTSPVLSTSSGVIAIGGGVPSEGHFTILTDKFNLEGLNFGNVQAQITSLIADRYSNFNVLEGTTVSFYSECGAIDRAVALDANGAGSVTFRTQNPVPENVVPDALGTGAGSCGDVCTSENAFISAFNTAFGIDITSSGNTNPRDGRCTIIAVADGEEEFTDTNASGDYEFGEPFVDTYDDIHQDKDDDSQSVDPVVAGNPYDPAFEDLIIDRDEMGDFDGMDGSWDDNKRIAGRINLLITGQPTLTLSANALNVADGGSQTILYSVHDVNYNRPIGGSTVAVALDGAGTLAGTTSNTYLDSNSLGSPIYSVTVSDDDPGDADPAEVGSLDFTWVWKGGTFSFSIPVTVD